MPSLSNFNFYLFIHKKDSNLKWHWHILGRLPTLSADISVFVYEFLIWVCQYDKAPYHGSLIWNSPLDTSHKEIKVSRCPSKLVQCNLDLVTLNLVTTCDLVIIFQRPFLNLPHKIIRFSDIKRFSDSFCGNQKCH